ncbi:glycogen/starch synthase [Luteolibacter ambystomatis]|uniref:starch synthase n=1 Tax=Luteolibacter ambystomatis TaxID=2824561 RepID=A0A975J379_9BACT|nr:glycogen/starch synthase [Luteolibacter ambystomatis]QUE53235.1 glycogen/starch synthase [Luteolibacter ambystomatis]
MAPIEHTLPGKTASSPEPSAAPARPVRRKLRRPRILLVTPELGESAFLSRRGNRAPCAKAGGLADVSALLLDTLSQEGLDVHVAMPNFRGMFHSDAGIPSRQLHLCQDREFFYRRSVYDGSPEANLRAAMAFQRDVIHYILPRLRPDIVHCHDWMTGLVPAAARAAGIPSLFTVHNLHDERTTMSYIEEKGVDVPRFWQHLYFEQYPSSYESMRDHGAVSLLGSGILAADHMNTVSPSFLHELSAGGHGAVRPVADAVRGKIQAGRAAGILNSIPARVRPSEDKYLAERYDEKTHVQGKRANKLALQKMLGLEEDADAPMLFWPSRLDPMQKGCQLLAEILYRVVSDYWGLGLQVVFVADGPFQPHFRRIAEFHGLQQRIAVHHFSEPVSRLGYAASDFTMMPSAYEPCGLSQMVALRYGSLPIVHGTGGLRDTVTHFDAATSSGNGFVFETHDANGLRWAIDQAIRFQIQPAADRQRQITRIMAESARAFSPESMVAGYMGIYSKLLQLRA